jgi:hypothetical protein
MTLGFGSDNFTDRVRAALKEIYGNTIGLTPGNYSAPSLTVAADGRITSIAAGSGGGSGSLGGARVNNVSSFPISNNTHTTLNWSNEFYDTDGYHDNSTNPSRLTAPATGTYLYGVQIQWSANASGERRVVIRVNGGGGSGTTGIIETNRVLPMTGSFTPTIHSITGIYTLSVGDYIETQVTQTSGGNLSGDGGDGCHFWIERLR